MIGDATGEINEVSARTIRIVTVDGQRVVVGITIAFPQRVIWSQSAS